MPADRRIYHRLLRLMALRRRLRGVRLGLRRRLGRKRLWGRRSRSRRRERGNSLPFRAIRFGGIIRRLIWRIGMKSGIWDCLASRLTRGGFTRRCTVGDCGRCGSSRDLDGRGHESAIPVFAGAGADGAFGGFRFAYLDGLRLGPRAFGGRSREMRGGDQFVGGYGSAVRPDSDRGCEHFDDDQFARGGDLGDVFGGGGKAGSGLEESCGDAAERHPEGIHRAEGIDLSARAFDALGDRHD